MVLGGARAPAGPPLSPPLAAMARKRKTDATPRLDEADRTLYSSFCAAANSLSQLYSQATAQQKLSFQSGERHALEKLHQWMVRKHEEESRLTVADIMSHIQHEIEYGGTDALVSPRGHSHPTSANPFTSIQPSASLYAQPAAGHAPRPTLSDQSKSTLFTNALSSPVRRSLQNYHLTQGAGNGGRNTEANTAGQNREANSASSNDTSMDMVSDSAGNGYY